MNTVLGIVGGIVVGAAIGYGAATMHKGAGHSSAGQASAGDDQLLLELDGTKFHEADLPPDVRSSLFEVREESHERLDGLLSQFALQLALAKDKNPAVKVDSLPPIEDLVDVPTPKDEEMKALFEANKARLPPNTSYEQIKPEIERYMKNSKISEALKAKNDEFKAKNRLVLLVPAPVAPKVALELAPFPAKGTSSNVLVEVADYLCPHCQASEPEVEAMLKDIGDKVKFVSVTFALHPEGLSGTLARGAYCARQQGDDAFWKYHQSAFSTGRAKGWKATDPDSKDSVLEVGTAAGLDKAKLETCLGSPEAQAFVKNTVETFHRAGVSGTPTFFINGRKLPMTGGKSLKETVMAGMEAASH